MGHSPTAHAGSFAPGYEPLIEGFFRDFDTVLTPVRLRLERAELAARAVSLVDTADLNNTFRPGRPINEALLEIIRERESHARETVFADPYYANISLFRDPATQRVLVSFARGHEAYDGPFLGLDFIEEYAWYSCEEPPEPHSQEVWDERGITWRSAQPLGEVPRSHELYGPRNHYPLQQAAASPVLVAKTAPKRHRRAKKAVHQLLVQTLLKRNTPSAPDGSQAIRDYLDTVHAVNGLAAGATNPLKTLLRQTLEPLNGQKLGGYLAPRNERMIAARAEITDAINHALHHIDKED